MSEPTAKTTTANLIGATQVALSRGAGGIGSPAFQHSTWMSKTLSMLQEPMAQARMPPGTRKNAQKSRVPPITPETGEPLAIMNAEAAEIPRNQTRQFQAAQLAWEATPRRYSRAPNPADALIPALASAPPESSALYLATSHGEVFRSDSPHFPSEDRHGWLSFQVIEGEARLSESSVCSRSWTRRGRG